MQPATEGSLDSVAGFVLGKGSEKRKGDSLGRAREVYRQGAGRLLLPGSAHKTPSPPQPDILPAAKAAGSVEKG